MRTRRTGVQVHRGLLRTQLASDPSPTVGPRRAPAALPTLALAITAPLRCYVTANVRADLPHKSLPGRRSDDALLATTTQSIATSQRSFHLCHSRANSFQCTLVWRAMPTTFRDSQIFKVSFESLFVLRSAL